MQNIIFFSISFGSYKKSPTFAPQLSNEAHQATGESPKAGPFVYRLGREIFIL